MWWFFVCHFCCTGACIRHMILSVFSELLVAHFCFSAGALGATADALEMAGGKCHVEDDADVFFSLQCSASTHVHCHITVAAHCDLQAPQDSRCAFSFPSVSGIFFNFFAGPWPYC